MSTSTSKHAAMEYANAHPSSCCSRFSRACAQGERMRHGSACILRRMRCCLPPSCACEVHNTRVEGSVVIELRPAVAAPALQEKSIEQKEEEEDCS